MDNKPHDKKQILFPNAFKKAGSILMLVSLVSAIVAKTMYPDISIIENKWFRLLLPNLFMLGLLMIAFAKDKTEDEDSMIARMKAFTMAILWVVTYVVIRPFIDLLFNDPPEDITAREAVISMLVIYLISYYSQNRIGRKILGYKKRSQNL